VKNFIPKLTCSTDDLLAYGTSYEAKVGISRDYPGIEELERSELDCYTEHYFDGIRVRKVKLAEKSLRELLEGFSKGWFY
jgi:hypothetical protein